MGAKLYLLALSVLIACSSFPVDPARAQGAEVRARVFIQGESARRDGGSARRGEARANAGHHGGSAAPARASAASPAQEFVSLLFGMRSETTQGAVSSQRPRIVITGRSDESEGGSRETGVAYCVRTCDGRFFPLSGRTRANDPAAAEQCAAFCPAARTEVFASSDIGRGIDAAYNKDGQAYSALPNAFAFRARLVENCSCTGNGAVGGLNHVDLTADSTLRRGDVVVTARGPRVFTGRRKAPPFRDEDFVAPAKFPDLPRDLRRRITELTVVGR